MGTSKLGFLGVHVPAIARASLGSLPLSDHEVAALTSRKAQNLEDWLIAAGRVLDARSSRVASITLQGTFQIPLWNEKGDDIAIIIECACRRARRLVNKGIGSKRRHIRRALRKLRDELADLRALKRALEELEGQVDELDDAFIDRLAWELDELTRNLKEISHGMLKMMKKIS